MADENLDALRQRIAELMLEHRALDQAITELDSHPNCDELMLRRLKKRKLLLKDEISALERQLVPDVPA